MKCSVCKCEVDLENMIFAPKLKKSYWFCIDCYKKSKFFNADTFDKLLKNTKSMIKEKEFTKKFCDLMMEHFGELDNRFFISKDKINNGKFSTKQFNSEYCRFTISDEELLDMLEKMIPYLKKSTQKFNRNGRTLLCHYVLVILYNSYPKYNRAKIDSLKHNEEQEKQTVASISETMIKSRQNVVENNSINLQDFIL